MDATMSQVIVFLMRAKSIFACTSLYVGNLSGWMNSVDWSWTVFQAGRSIEKMDSWITLPPDMSIHHQGLCQPTRCWADSSVVSLRFHSNVRISKPSERQFLYSTRTTKPKVPFASMFCDRSTSGRLILEAQHPKKQRSTTRSLFLVRWSDPPQKIPLRKVVLRGKKKQSQESKRSFALCISVKSYGLVTVRGCITKLQTPSQLLRALYTRTLHVSLPEG